jgi:hypothetical protein
MGPSPQPYNVFSHIPYILNCIQRILCCSNFALGILDCLYNLFSRFNSRLDSLSDLRTI